MAMPTLDENPERLVPLSPAKVRRLRHAARLTQEELAQRAGVTHGTIARLEQGRFGAARGRTADALADALGVRLELLTEGPDHD